MLHNSSCSTTERLTNALEYGVPQDRDRILLFGVKTELLNGSNLEDFSWSKYIKYYLAEVKGKSWAKTSPFVENSVTECPSDIPQELTVQYWFNKNKVEEHPNSKFYCVPRAGISKMKTVDDGDDSKKLYKQLHMEIFIYCCLW